MTPLLEVRALRMEGRDAQRGWQPIVRDVSFSLQAGEVLALIGESGAGKSTIALAACGYARPGCRFSGGEVLFQGQDVLAMGLVQRRRLRGRDVGFIAQSAAAAFNPALTLGHQITEATVQHGIADAAGARALMAQHVARLRLPDPGQIVHRYPHEVSGGQLQRLMAVMAMNPQPQLLLFDEPTTAIDVTTQVEVLAAFKDALAASRAAALYVSHDLAVVAQIATRIIVLRHGQIVEAGATADILEQPQAPYTRELLAAVQPSLPKTGAASPALAKTDTAPALAKTSGGSAAPEPTSILSLEGVTAGYGRHRGKPKVTVLSGLSMRLLKGQALGVIGESGCGKSTLARVVAGLTPYHEGRLSLQQTVLAPDVRQRDREIRRRIQIVTQMPDVAFNPKRSIGHALARPLQYFFGMDATRRAARVAELLELVELPAHFAQRLPHELSGGQKQRVNLARALAAEPDLVLCDEVTSALDTVVGASILGLLRRLKEELGLSILFISHDLATVGALCDEVAVFYAGTLVEIGPLAHVIQPPFHPYARLLISSVPALRPGWLEAHRGTDAAQQAMKATVQLGRAGCPFAPRCPLVMEDRCFDQIPPRHRLPRGHLIACHRPVADLGEDATAAAPAAMAEDPAG